MKRLVCVVCGYWFFVSAFAQTINLSIAKDKTTSLIFPFLIKHVDRGTKDILVQQVKEAGNILLVKAGIENFSETNLSVITEDGNLYSFSVKYGKKPDHLVYHLEVTKNITIADYANGLLDNPQTLFGVKNKRFGIIAKVLGIYVQHNTLFYQLEISNETPLDYDIELIRFYLSDVKKGKRTSIQENEMKPLHVSGMSSGVKAKSSKTFVIAVEKFTIPDSKIFAIQIMEKHGGRHLLLRLNNNKILKAIQLAEMR